MDFENIGVKNIRKLLLDKEVSAEEITNIQLEKIEKSDLNAFITLDTEGARESARRLDEKIKLGEDIGSLAGVPVGVKDNIATYNLRTTAGSKMLENFVPTYEATVVERIRREDGIIIGKTNMDEFAMGSSTETSYYGSVKNPVDKDRVPGGSSGGSAASVKSKEVLLALGTDTGGSVRQPAAFCGVVGLKPTYGLVSRNGVISMANSLDQVGILGNSVEDTVDMLNVIMGEDSLDSTTVGTKNALANFDGDINNLKIALPKEFFEENIHPGIKESVLDAVKLFEKLGARVEYVSLPSLKYALSAYYLINTSEVSSNLSRFDGVRYGYRTENYDSLKNFIGKVVLKAWE